MHRVERFAFLLVVQSAIVLALQGSRACGQESAENRPAQETLSPSDDAPSEEGSRDETMSEEEASLRAFIRSRVMAIEKIPVILSEPQDNVPPDYSDWVFEKKVDSYAGRAWPTMEFSWEPSELVFQPPYWEHTPLERYGQTRHPRLQPVLSGLHFFGTFAIIPYKMGIDGPHDHISTLGYYRPGSPTPCLRQRLPWEWNAALLEAGAWTGMVFILP